LLLTPLGEEKVSHSLTLQTAAAGVLVTCMLVAFMLRFGRGRLWLPIFAAVVVLDQVAKWVVNSLLGHAGAVSVSGGLVDIELASNTFQGFGASSTWVLPITLIALVISARLYSGLAEMKYSMSAAAQLGCGLLAGALTGLALDRLLRGYAVDFLALRQGGFVYNLADLAALSAFAVFALRGISMALEVWPRRAQIARRLASEWRG
jgi:lipoprotein signal peptidase